MARAGLSREGVIALALRVVDDGGTQGFADLTLAKVATAAGVATPSLYKHVGSLADLRRSVALVAVNDLTRATAAATIGRSGSDALSALAWAVRDFAREHPGRYAAIQLSPDLGAADDDPLSLAGAETIAVIVAVLRGFDLPEARTVDAIRAVRSAVHGFVSLELLGGFGMPDDVDHSFEVLVRLLVAGVEDLSNVSEPA
ncbi:TetR/AcrR family transcriptional regulator [Oerskovia sp. KBS0722]|uniref:TetR/AcrR family transcriptional regulator n=1 Tax=Oerskovia sp. KBS0722 TaxID=1179673 RepID=UPI00110E8CC1|nr:TetR-like C-terminal domain-containing protein [Oerskovia sp. KBS0722]QDW64239.1 TetR/AcrR family transcriptional regulator [Oerskovia sp. KBS0722]